MIEILVTLSIVALIVALLLPAVQSAREVSRRMQCANHLKTLAGAAIAWTELHGHVVPTAVSRETVDHPRREMRNWVVDLLPYLDHAAVADRWNHNVAATDPHNLQVAMTHIATLTCPADTTLLGGGDLSYAINGGIGSWILDEANQCYFTADALNHRIDLNGDGTVCVENYTPTKGSDFDILFHTRLSFWKNESPDPRLRAQRFRPHTMATVTDGVSHTLLFAENLRTGGNSARPEANWSAPQPRLTSVYAGSDMCLNRQCRFGNIDWSKANSGYSAINAGRTAREGLSPFPSSYHDGGVNVALLDGSVRFLSESVDGRVCFGLYTPQGDRLAGTALDCGMTPLPF